MMKIFPLMLFVVLGLHSAGQTRIQLVMKQTGGHAIDKVDAFDLSQKEILDFGYKDTLELKFNKRNIDCYNIRYHENGKMFRQQIWLDTGHIKIEAHLAGDELVIDTVTGSPFYYYVSRFYESYFALAKEHDTARVNAFLLKTFRDNMDNPFSINAGLYYVMLNQNQKIELLKFKTLADGQGDRFSWFLLYPMVVERASKILSVEKINLAGYDFYDTEDKKKKLHLEGAEYYVLDFWFLGCKPCLEQHIEIKEKEEKLKNKKVRMISISTDSDRQKWKAYLSGHGYQWANYLQERAPSITNDLNIASFPTYIIVNSNGDIVESYNSFSDILKRFGVAD